MSAASNSTALITGASDRIGRAVAFLLAERGYRIVITYRSNEAGARTTCEQISPLAPAFSIQHDFCASTPGYGLVEQASHLTGTPVTCLVCAASFFEKSSLASMDPHHLVDNFWVHLFSPMLLAQELHTHLQRHQITHGNLIAFCDQRVYRRTTTRAAYELSKKSLLEFTKIAALSFAPDMRVNSISPGPILQATTETDTEFRALIEKSVPLKRQGTVNHILQALEFLLACDYVTGVDIPIDGGEHL